MDLLQNLPPTDWECRIAERVRTLIVSKNGNRWPRSYEEWHATARRLGLKVKTRPLQTDFSACLLNDVIICRAVDEERLCRWIAHEVCEGVLRRDCGEEPFHFVPGPHDAYHRIARMLEPK